MTLCFEFDSSAAGEFTSCAPAFLGRQQTCKCISTVKAGWQRRTRASPSALWLPSDGFLSFSGTRYTNASLKMLTFGGSDCMRVPGAVRMTDFHFTPWQQWQHHCPWNAGMNQRDAWMVGLRTEEETDECSTWGRSVDVILCERVWSSFIAPVWDKLLGLWVWLLWGIRACAPRINVGIMKTFFMFGDPRD